MSPWDVFRWAWCGTSVGWLVAQGTPNSLGTAAGLSIYFILMAIKEK